MAARSDQRDIGARDTRWREQRRGYRRAADRRNAALGAFGEWVGQRQREALFLIDERLAPIFLNRAARESLEQVEWLRLSERELEIRDAQLRHKVRSALGAWPGASGDGTLRLSSGERTLDLTRLQVSFSKSRAYAISLVQSSELKMTREVLVKRLRLTRAQAQVAALIYDGSNQVSVAERLGVSINTVKTHMKGIFAKAGVRSQRGLIRKVGELLGRG